MEFIIDEKLLKREVVAPLLKEAEELTAIFTASRKTARKVTSEDSSSKVEEKDE